MPQHLSSTARGLGAEHRRRRALLPPPSGQPCPRCGEPVLPGQALDAGHEHDRALGGVESPLQWEHASCNRRAGGKLSQILAKTRAVRGEEDRQPSRRW